MAACARVLSQANGFGQDAISVVGERSDTLTLPPEEGGRRFDVMVTEIFDSALLGEGILPTLRDAHRRLLRPGATVVPSAACESTPSTGNDEI